MATACAGPTRRPNGPRGGGRRARARRQPKEEREPALQVAREGAHHCEAYRHPKEEREHELHAQRLRRHVGDEAGAVERGAHREGGRARAALPKQKQACTG